MSTIAIIGAGRGLGAAVARRFGREGFDVALVARNEARVQALAGELGEEGISARGFTADVRDPASISATLEEISQTLGIVEVLQYSPLPQKEFLRPVLESGPADYVGPVEFSIYGPAAAAHAVIPGMRSLKKGTILFVNGGSAVKPAPGYAGTSVAFAGQSALGQMLHDALGDDGIHVGQLIIPGAIEPDNPEKNVETIADKLWAIHDERGEYRTFAVPLD